LNILEFQYLKPAWSIDRFTDETDFNIDVNMKLVLNNR